jgi:hypothetical protein
MVRYHEALAPLMVPIEQVTQLPGNYRNGDIDLIMESMMTNGVYAPVVAQRSTGHILAGNHRYAALLGLGAQTIPVLWMDVDDVTAKRIAIVDNRSSDVAQDDTALLVEMLREITAEDGSLVGTGWDVSQLLELEASLAPSEAMFGGYNVEPGFSLFGVTVQCEDEATQTELIAELSDRPGLKVRGLSL